MPKWRIIDSETAPSRYLLIQGYITNKLWFSERLLKALNISMVTKIDRETVEAVLAGRPTNISQSLNPCSSQRWKLLYKKMKNFN